MDEKNTVSPLSIAAHEAAHAEMRRKRRRGLDNVTSDANGAVDQWRDGLITFDEFVSKLWALRSEAMDLVTEEHERKREYWGAAIVPPLRPHSGGE